MKSISDLRDYLVKNGVKPSYPRLKVLEYLVRHRNHPTADQIYNALVEEMPTLSKTTVYNTLNLFAQKNVVAPISIDNNEARFDADLKEHGHFKCEQCGKIVDFGIKLGEQEIPELKGFKICSKNVYFKGICPECLE